MTSTSNVFSNWHNSKKKEKCSKFVYVLYVNRNDGYNGSLSKAMIFKKRKEAIQFMEDNPDLGFETYLNSNGLWTNLPEKIKVKD